MRKLMRRKGYAAGGLLKRDPPSEAWIDQLPYGKDDNTFYQDKKMAIQPNMDVDKDIEADPETGRAWMEHSRGGKVKRVLPVKKVVSVSNFSLLPSKSVRTW